MASQTGKAPSRLVESAVCRRLTRPHSPYRIARYVLAHGHARESVLPIRWPRIPAEHPVARQGRRLGSHLRSSSILRRVRGELEEGGVNPNPVIRCARPPAPVFIQPQPSSGLTESVSSDSAERYLAGPRPQRVTQDGRGAATTLALPFDNRARNPARVLPTIRSRCRRLDLQPLAPDALARVLTSLDGVDEEGS